jgi:cytosine deaminase
MCNLLIRNVRLGEGGPLTDIVIRGGRMATIEPAFPCDAVENIDGGGAFAPRRNRCLLRIGGTTH